MTFKERRKKHFILLSQEHHILKLTIEISITDPFETLLVFVENK